MIILSIMYMKTEVRIFFPFKSFKFSVTYLYRRNSKWFYDFCKFVHNYTDLKVNGSVHMYILNYTSSLNNIAIFCKYYWKFQVKVVGARKLEQWEISRVAQNCIALLNKKKFDTFFPALNRIEPGRQTFLGNTNLCQSCTLQDTCT